LILVFIDVMVVEVVVMELVGLDVVGVVDVVGAVEFVLEVEGKLVDVMCVVVGVEVVGTVVVDD
jgi:hypothetical protein